jgi:AcrR family transcriptional regulator
MEFVDGSSWVESLNARPHSGVRPRGPCESAVFVMPVKAPIRSQESPNRQRPRRRRLAVDERRAQLVRLGRDLFQTYQYAEISIDKFARIAGVSKGLIYHYFPSKHAFFAAVMGAHEREAERGELESGGEAEDVERLIAALDEYLEHAESNARALTALLNPGPELDSEATRLAFAAGRRLLTRSLAGLPADYGRLRRTLRGFIGYVEGCVIDWLTHGDVERAELRSRLAGAIRQMSLLEGLRAARMEDSEPPSSSQIRRSVPSFRSEMREPEVIGV